MPPSPVYTVTPTLSALANLRGPLPCPHRSRELPPVYIWDSSTPHPQRNAGSAATDGKTYIIFIDSSDAGKSRADFLAQRQKVPLGRSLELHLLGLLELFPGDWVFARHFDSDGNAEEDILQIFLTCDPELDEARTRLGLARDAVFGPREERTADSVRFERGSRAHRSCGDDRAYGIGEMVQITRKVDAPAAAAKVFDGTLDEEQLVQKELLEASTDVIVKSYISAAPTRWRTRTKEFSEVINGPRTGSDDNFWFPAFQLNLAPAQDGDGDGSLIGDMKIKGDSHMDTFDSAAHLSCMLVLSDLPEGDGFEPGRFHFLAHGFYVSLECYYTVYFSGRLPHGGTAPLAPPGKKAPNWAYRGVLIGYPPKYIVNGDVRHTLAALPHRAEPLYISPEMTGINSQHPDNVVSTTHSNYACDGIMTMTPLAHVDFYTRSLLQLNIMLARQLPRSYDIRIDRDRFLSAFSGLHEGQPLVPSQWALGPDGAVHQEADPDGPREQACARYKAFYGHVAPGIHRAPNVYPEPVRSNVRRRTKPKGAARNNDATERKRKRNAKLDDARLEAARAGAMTAVFGAAGLNPSWDATPEPRDCPPRKRRRTQDCPDVVTTAANHSASDGCFTGESDVGEADVDCPDGQPARLDSMVTSESDLEGSLPRDGQVATGYFITSTYRTSPDARGDGAGCLEHVSGPNVDSHEAGDLHVARDDDTASVFDWLDAVQIATSSSPPTVADVGALNTRKLAAGRGFVARFNVTALQREARRVRDLTGNLNLLEPDHLRSAFDVLGQIDLGAVPSSSLPRSPQAVMQTLGAISVLRCNADWHHAWSNIFRQRVMLCERRLVAYFTSSLASLAREMVHTGDLPTLPETHAPLRRLVDCVKSRLELRLPLVLEASHYLPGLPVNTVFKEKAHRRLYSQDDLLEVVPRVVVAAMRCWFGLADDYTTAARAHFVTVIIDHFGSAALLFPHVWDTYISMPPWLRDYSRVPRGSSFDPAHHHLFIDAIAASALADHTSAVFRALHVVKMLYQEFKDFAHEALGRAVAPPAAKQPRPTLIDFNYDAEEDAMTGPCPVRLSKLTAVRKILHLLNTGFQVAVGTTTPRTGMVPDIALDSDKFQPVREMGLSRTRINGVAGKALTSHLLNSRAGLFSILVFRNVLYNSPYLCSDVIAPQDRRVLFDDEADFARHLAEIKRRYPQALADGFFCNVLALGGQPTKGRSASTSSHYWQLSKLLSTSSFSSDSATFSQVMADIKQHSRSVDGSVNVPGFGPVSQYLTVADMSHTGLFPMPTPEEVGSYIYGIYGSAVTGLLLLGYLHPTAGVRSTRNEVVTAFSEFYLNVTSALVQDDLNKFRWNTVAAEHILSKVFYWWDFLASID